MRATVQLVATLAVARATVVASTGPGAARLAAQEVGTWLRGRGGSTSAIVGPTKHGLGLLSGDDVSAGDVVVSVPSDCMLSTSFDAVALNPQLGSLIKSVPSDPAYTSARLALVLLAERARGERSDFATYVGSLPKAYTLPIFWSPDAITQLRGYPNVQRRLLKQAKFISTFASEHLVTAAANDAFSGLRVDADAYGWANAACSSRAFRIGGDGERALVPIIDLGNHAPKGAANCDVRGTLGGRVELVANRPIALGEELTYCYGDLSNDDFLIDYGFLPAKNAHDECMLAWAGGGLLESAIATAGLDTKGGGDAWRTAAMRSALPAGLETVSIVRGGLSAHAMAACRIAVASDAAAVRKADGGRKPLQPASSEVRALKVAAATIAIGITSLPEALEGDGAAEAEADAALAAAFMEGKRRLCADALAAVGERIKRLREGDSRAELRGMTPKKAAAGTRRKRAGAAGGAKAKPARGFAK